VEDGESGTRNRTDRGAGRRGRPAGEALRRLVCGRGEEKQGHHRENDGQKPESERHCLGDTVDVMPEDQRDDGDGAADERARSSYQERVPEAFAHDTHRGSCSLISTEPRSAQANERHYPGSTSFRLAAGAGDGHNQRMIFIVVTWAVKPEHADEWLNIVSDFTQATRNEPGNLFFDWSRSVDDPARFVLVEAFADGDAGAAHVGTEHFRTAMARLPQYLASTPEIINVEIPGASGWSEMGELTVG
jgi:quinol monooxygenase YgiN